MTKDQTPRSPFEPGGFHWGSIADVAVDAQGRTLFAGEERGGSSMKVACFDASFTPLWVRHGLPVSGSDARLTLHPDGRILLWHANRHSALVLNKDGEDAGKVGVREKPDATSPALDLADADDLVVCADGTYLLVGFNCLTRFTAEQVAVPTWPQTGLWRSWFPERPAPFYLHRSETERTKRSADDSGAAYWRKRPLLMDSSDVRAFVVGAELYLVSDSGGRDDCVGKFAADGSLMWSVPVLDIDKRRPAVDGDGNVYVLVSPRKRDEVWRIPQQGGPAVKHLTDWRDGGPVDDPSYITVSAKGAVALWDSYGRLTLIEPNGDVKRTAEAEKDLQEKRAKRQRKIDLDEDPD